MQNQACSFLIFILNGLLLGILFDIFRILRKSFKTPDFVTYIEDMFFWILSGMILLYSIFRFNNGELRLYIFIGIFIGILIYMLLFSKIFINVSTYIIKVLKKIFHILIFIPIKFIINVIKKVIYKPIILLCINIGKITKKIHFNKKMSFKKVSDISSQ